MEQQQKVKYYQPSDVNLSRCTEPEFSKQYGISKKALKKDIEEYKIQTMYFHSFEDLIKYIDMRKNPENYDDKFINELIDKHIEHGKQYQLQLFETKCKKREEKIRSKINL